MDFDLEEQLFSQCLLPNEGDIYEENMANVNNNDMNVDDEEEDEEEEEEEEEEENMEYDSRMYAHWIWD